MKTILLAICLLTLPVAAQTDDFYFDPHAAIGFNPAQGTNLMLGADVGFSIDEQFRTGIGAYFSAGEQPTHDREFGVGPFVSYAQPLASFLVGQVRQEINYVNLHDPYKTYDASGNAEWNHEQETGLASVTSAGLHIFLTRNFVLSGGYRLVVALSNSKLDDGRSGAFFGFSLGI